MCVCVVCVCVCGGEREKERESHLITHHRRPVLSNLSTLKSVTVGQTSAEALESFTV